MNYIIKTIFSVFIYSLVLSSLNCQEYKIGRINNESNYYATLEICQTNDLTSSEKKFFKVEPRKYKPGRRFILGIDQIACIKIFVYNNIYMFPIPKECCNSNRIFEISQDNNNNPIVIHNINGYTLQNPWVDIKPQIYNSCINKFISENELEKVKPLNPHSPSQNQKTYKKHEARTIMKNFAEPDLKTVQTEATFNWDQKFLCNSFKA